jgi:predicted RNA-binding protein with PIN domain
VADGDVLPAARPEDTAALAYLLRPAGWQTTLEAAAVELAGRERAAAGAATVDAVVRLTEQLAAVRAGARADVQRLTGELAQAREESEALRRRVREMGQRAASAERAALEAREELALLRAGRVVDVPGAGAPESELRRLQARLQQAEAALAAARTASREGRHGQDVRLRVLLDALLGAAGGLRRELALAPLEERPADAVASDLAVPELPATVALQGRSSDDPTLLGALLSAPAVHLLVDGYNVTKSGYGALPLESQRTRLLAGLGALAARTGAETTVVFDGADRVTPLAPASPRAVRVLFSRTGETADEVLLRLVDAEPRGRPVVVVSSDREVVEAAQRAGARPVPSRALLRLLER